MWLLRRLVQPKQILGGPAKGLGLVAPAREEGVAILYRLPPPLGGDQVGAAGLERGHNPPIATLKIGKTTTSSTLKTFKTQF